MELFMGDGKENPTTMLPKGQQYALHIDTVVALWETV